MIVPQKKYSFMEMPSQFTKRPRLSSKGVTGFRAEALDFRYFFIQCTKTSTLIQGYREKVTG